MIVCGAAGGTAPWLTERDEPRVGYMENKGPVRPVGSGHFDVAQCAGVCPVSEW